MGKILTLIFLLWSTSATATLIDFTCFYQKGYDTPRTSHIWQKGGSMQFTIEVDSNYKNVVLGTYISIPAVLFTELPSVKDYHFSSHWWQIMLNPNGTVPPDGIIHSFHGVPPNQSDPPKVTYEGNNILGLSMDKHMLSSQFNIYTGELFLMQGKHPSMRDFLLEDNRYINATYMCQRSQSLLD